MNDIKAILFDFDGTLVHSIDLLVAIFSECLIEQGITPANPDTIRRLIGEPLDVIFRKLTNLLDVEKFNQSFHAKEDIRHTAEHIRLVKDTIPTLEFLKKQGFKLGIVSTKQRELVEPLSRELNIESFFDVVVGGKDVVNHKPHPEPILIACERLGIKPVETLFVGDSLLDLNAAKAAGSIFVGVLTGSASREDFEKNRADYIFGHIGEIANLTRKLLN
jgi:phosphoglycolate phosphatase